MFVLLEGEAFGIKKLYMWKSRYLSNIPDPQYIISEYNDDIKRSQVIILRLPAAAISFLILPKFSLTGMK